MEEVTDPVIIELAEQLHVQPQWVALALQSWSNPYTTSREHRQAGNSDNNAYFFYVPWLVSARGNNLRRGEGESYEKTKALFKRFKGVLRFQNDRGEKAVTGLLLKLQDNGQPVLATVTEGNHRINAFNERGYLWFPISVSNNQYIDEGGYLNVVGVPHSSSRAYSDYGIPSNLDPRWTINSTHVLEPPVGYPVLLDIRAVYDALAQRMKRSKPKTNPGDKRDEKPKRRRSGRRRKKTKANAPDDLDDIFAPYANKTKFLMPACSACGTYMRQTIDCKGCDGQASYCSDQCKDDHWEAGHDEVCELLASHSSSSGE